ncbi:MAG: DUF3089 domain-containing protein [Maricaulaceae bacterium]
MGRALSLGLAAMLLVLAGAAFEARDELYRLSLYPDIPFEIEPSPPPPDFAQAQAWLARPDTPADLTLKTPPAEVFLLAPTSGYALKTWNIAYDAPQAVSRLRDIFLAEYGPAFPETWRISAPLYRQAGLYAMHSHREDAREARRRAYTDVARAFAAFLDAAPDKAPLVMVGVEQGGLHLSRLLQSEFDDPRLAERLAAAYVIDIAYPDNAYQAGESPFPLCQAPDAARCVLAWSAFERGRRADIARHRERALFWAANGRLAPRGGRDLACAPPAGVIDAKAYSAQCADGVLVVVGTPTLKAPQRDWLGGGLKPKPQIWFAEAIAQDVQVRGDALETLFREQGRLAPPLEAEVVLREAPVEKVPE